MPTGTRRTKRHQHNLTVREQTRRLAYTALSHKGSLAKRAGGTGRGALGRRAAAIELAAAEAGDGEASGRAKWVGGPP